MEPVTERARNRHRRAIVVLVAVIGVLVGGVAVARHAGRPATRPALHDAGPRHTALRAAPPSSTTTSTTSARREQPMYQSGANVRIVSTVSTGSGAVQISGTAAPGASVTVNGAPVVVDPDGTWAVTLNVGRGPTSVNVLAVSADGSSRSSSSVMVSG